MKTRVKICGITRHDDAAEAVAHGADALGFVLWKKSARYVEPALMADIARRLPPFVTAVAVFVNPTPEEVRSVLDVWPAATLQFHGEESPAFCAQFGRPWIKTARARAGLDLQAFFADYMPASAWLVDAYHEQLYGGTGNPFDWSLVPRRTARPLILSGGLTAANVGEAVAALKPYAVDVSSGVEIDKGIKDAAKIAAFLAAVRQAGARQVAQAEEQA